MKRLTLVQRYAICVMKNQGYKQKYIALTIEKDKSVVSRELKHNCDKRIKKYEADLAHRKYQQRQRDKPKHIHFTEEVKQCLDGLLLKDYSSEQIAGRSKIKEKPFKSAEVFISMFVRIKSKKVNYICLSGEREECIANEALLRIPEA